MPRGRVHGAPYARGRPVGYASVSNYVQCKTTRRHIRHPILRLSSTLLENQGQFFLFTAVATARPARHAVLESLFILRAHSANGHDCVRYCGVGRALLPGGRAVECECIISTREHGSSKRLLRNGQIGHYPTHCMRVRSDRQLHAHGLALTTLRIVSGFTSTCGNRPVGRAM